MNKSSSGASQIVAAADQVVESLRNFLHTETASSILLLAATVAALLAANTPLFGLYQDFIQMPVEISIGTFSIDKYLHYWINDGLMALFFLVVGLELKREFLEGELKERSAIVLPASGAIGGMIVPALVYVAITYDNPVALNGWAIPAATDIAFALGIMSLLGKHVPQVLKVFLISLAIFDDIGAIIIIALFYTENLSLLALGTALACTVVLYILNRRGVCELPPYFIVGVIMWTALLKSGVHATLAGVVIAMFIPLHHKRDTNRSPLREVERDLHTIVAFVTLPLFAFVNAGVRFVDLELSAVLHPVTLGVVGGLVIGKPIGILLFCWIATKLNWVKLPESLSWVRLWAVATLCGVGFTMSLFIGNLAFADLEMRAFDQRIGILCGSLIAGVLGYFLLRSCVETEPQEEPQKEMI